MPRKKTSPDETLKLDWSEREVRKPQTITIDWDDPDGEIRLIRAIHQLVEMSRGSIGWVGVYRACGYHASRCQNEYMSEEVQKQLAMGEKDGRKGH